MPGSINFPPPRVRWLALAFHDHRKVGSLVLCKVHATKYKADRAGPRVDEILSNLSRDRGFSLDYDADGEV